MNLGLARSLGFFFFASLASFAASVGCSGDGGIEVAANATLGASAATTSTTTPTVLASGQSGPLFIAVDGPSVFWSNNTGGEIMTAPVAGDEPPRVLFQGQAPRRVRASQGTVYFVDTNAGAVMQVFESTGTVAAIANRQTQPMGLAVGPHGSVYWTNAGTESAGYRDGSVMAYIRGGEPEAVATSQSQAMGLDVSDSYVYWSSVVDKSIRRQKITETGPAGPTEIVATGQNGPSTVALDSANVYWTNAYDGTVMAAAIAGDGTTTRPRQIASHQTGLTSVVSDGVSVYWTNAGTGSGTDGSVVKAPASGGPAVVLASRQGQPAGIAVDGQYVFWTDIAKGTVLRLPK